MLLERPRKYYLPLAGVKKVIVVVLRWLECRCDAFKPRVANGVGREPSNTISVIGRAYRIVIGEIRGTRYPDEIIVIGGHFDSWDKGHGAHDDGGGCMQALEVLNIFKRLKIQPSRTIRCVLFIDEEQRQTGARTYASIAISNNWRMGE